MLTIFVIFGLQTVFGQTYITTTIAGGEAGGFANGNGTNALFSSISGLEVDNNGQIFVVESSNPRIRKIDSERNVTTFAGTGVNGHDNGNALSATFYSPQNLVKDTNGNIYVCDRFNSSIRKIDINNNVTTYCGYPGFFSINNGGFGDGPVTLTSTSLFHPVGICFDKQNNLIIGDTRNYRVRKIDLTANYLSTIAGSTQAVQDGPISIAKFDFPYQVAVDSQNNIYVTERQFPYIRKIDINGNVSTLGPNIGGANGIAIDNNDNIYITQGNQVKKILPNGTLLSISGQTSSGNIDGDSSTSRLTSPTMLDVDAQGNIYVIDNNARTIKKITFIPASASCEAATSLIANSGTVDIGAITGDMPQTSCILANDAPQLKANWWKFTPSQNGQLLVTSNISQNNNNDTRLRIYSGTCNSLVCVAGNDNISAQNFSSQLSQINLTAGTTYYIVFDNYNTNLSNGSFYYEFTPITGDSLSCSTAKTLAPYSATVNIGTIAGTIPASPVCYSFSQANPNANWWSFTPTQNGLLDITTITPQNAATVDTRLSIFTGTCSALTCFAGSDNVSTTDLRSNLNDLILQAGTTYYFVFDDKVSDNAAVNFFYEFTPQTCFRPNTVTFGTPTENTINVNWTAPTVGNTNPSSYTIQIGPRDYVVDSPAALQTITGLVANSTTITGLTANTVYDIYIKSNCSASDSSVWYGPFTTATEFTAVTPLYSENFDSDVSFLFVGWNRSGGTISTLWRTYTGATPFVASGTRAIYSPVEPALNTPTNTFAYTRKLNLTGGQNYIVSFMARQFIASGTATSPSLNVSYTSNVDYTNPATHNQIVNLTNTSATAYTSENHNFSVTNSGQYRIAFKNDVQRTAGTGTAWLMLDSVTVSSALSTENFSKTTLQLYPNPVLDNITIQNDNNIEIQTINIVDLKGRVVKEFKYSTLNNNLINISELESGIYIINLITSSQQVLSKKIIKE